MFSRVAFATRDAGRGFLRTGRRTFSSYGASTGARRVFGFATAAATVGVLSFTLMAQEHRMTVMECAGANIERKNTAFVFIKPHAVTPGAKTLVSQGLTAKGMTILSEGSISAEEIDKRMLIDQHYYAIASKATLLKPDQLNVSPAVFKKAFGLEWKDALAQGKVFNAMDACAKLGLDADGINTVWAKAKDANKLVKLGGGFYCGLIDTIPNQPPIYVFNGFFMKMRNDFVAPGSSIYYYVVEWDSTKLSWADFRGSVLGPTDPADCPADSLRGKILANWKALGLASVPNVGQNGVHASASPFEALSERMNWLGVKCSEDEFGKQLLAAGVSEKTINEWCTDPVVTYGAKSQPIVKSLFDSLEDSNSDMCLAKAIMINSQ